MKTYTATVTKRVTYPVDRQIEQRNAKMCRHSHTLNMVTGFIAMVGRSESRWKNQPLQ